jgi:hypothetical protein
MEESAMNKVSRVAFSALTGLALVTALSVLPSNAQNAKQADPAQQQQQTQTVSGKIASFDKTSLTLDVATGTASVSTTGAAPSSMTFAIDKNTTVDGKLKVGSTADVTYRQEAGANVAISIHVS